MFGLNCLNLTLRSLFCDDADTLFPINRAWSKRTTDAPTTRKVVGRIFHSLGDSLSAWYPTGGEIAQFAIRRSDTSTGKPKRMSTLGGRKVEYWKAVFQI